METTRQFPRNIHKAITGQMVNVFAPDGTFLAYGKASFVPMTFTDPDTGEQISGEFLRTSGERAGRHYRALCSPGEVARIVTVADDGTRKAFAPKGRLRLTF